MALYTRTQALDAARKRGATTAATASRMLRESASAARNEYDVFLSHAYLDAKLVLGVKAIIEAVGKTVYVDWIDDSQLDRESVTAATAARLRERMRTCRALVYATSRAATESKWMPWELGFFDGHKSGARIAILPLVEQTDDTYSGQEYLGLYPTIEEVVAPSGLRRPYAMRYAPYHRYQRVVEARSLDSLVTGSPTYEAVRR